MNRLLALLLMATITIFARDLSAQPIPHLTNDLGGTANAPTVVGIQNHGIAAPSGTGTTITYNSPSIGWGYPNATTNFAGPTSPPSNGSWSQATWYLDPASTIATCNDATNTGLSSSSPLCTCQEMQRRLGTTSPMWQQNTSIVWDSSQTSTSDRCDLGNPSNFTVSVSGALNTSNQLFTNTISAFTARNQTTGALYSIAKVTGMAVGTLVYNSTRNSYAIVHSVSGSTVTLSQPMTTAPAEDNGWTNGNTIVGYAPYTAWYSTVAGISSPISISNLVIGTSANGNANLNAYGQVSLTNLSFLADVVFGLQNSPDDTDASMVDCFSNNDVTNQTTSSIYLNSGSTSTNVTVYGGDIAEFFGSFTLTDDVIAANRGSNLPHNIRNGVLDGVYIDSGATILTVGTTTASTWVWGLGGISNSGILSYTATGDAVFEPTVSLSFGIGGTAITTACSLSASAGQPCNISLTAANLSATAGASGFGDYAFLPGGELYARAGTGPPSGIAAPVLTTLGTAGQALFTNAAANAIAWASCSGDLSCSTSTPGLYTVNSISGSSPVVIESASTLEWAKGVSGPTVTQAAPTSDVATTNLTIQSQAPFSSASTNKSAGSVNLSIPGTVGAGTTYGSVNFLYNTSVFGGVAPLEGVTAGGYAIWLNESSFGSGNYALLSSGSGSGVGVGLNSPGFSGTTEFTFAANSGHSANINGFQVGSSTPELGGGTNILGIANATTNPTSCPSTGSILWTEAEFVYACFGTSTRLQIAGANVANYGTGATSFTADGVVLGEGTSALSATAAPTTGQILGQSGGVPGWVTASSLWHATTFTSSGTYTTQSTETTDVFCACGGGAGGSAGLNGGVAAGLTGGAFGGTGGGGSPLSCIQIVVPPSTGLTVTIGNGGNGAGSAGFSGSVGGATSIANGATILAQVAGASGGFAPALQPNVSSATAWVWGVPGSSVTSQGSLAALANIAMYVPGLLPSSGGQGGGQVWSVTANGGGQGVDVAAQNGLDSPNGFTGGNGGTTGAFNADGAGGYGGGGGGAGGFGDGAGGSGAGGAGATSGSGNGSNGSAGASASANSCAGGQGGGSGGSSTGGTPGGAGAGGSGGSGKAIIWGFYSQRFLDSSEGARNDNARPWNRAAPVRELARAENF